jgi:sigma-E factor negative regulatory protein RseC
MLRDKQSDGLSDAVSEELATVVAVDGAHAWVECERRSACHGCQQQRDCGTGTIANAFTPSSPRLRVALTASVQVGDQIRVGIAPATLVRSAALVYVLPLCCLLLGALLGQLWLLPLLGGGEAVTIVSCLVGALIGFLLVRYGASRLLPAHYGPRMLGVVVPTRSLDS